MRTLNVTSDRQQFVESLDRLLHPARHTWQELLGRNAMVLQGDPSGRRTLQQRDLLRGEDDAILRDYARNGLAPGHVVIKVLFAGICGSDLKNAFGEKCDYPYNPAKALLHEMSGIVVAKGDGVEGLEIGDLVVPNPLLTDCMGNPIIEGSDCSGPNGPFSSIHTHGFAQECVIHPASRVHKIDHTRIGPRLAAMVEPFACAHAAIENQGQLSKRLQDRRKDEFVARYGRYNYGVVILGGGPLGITMALTAKHRGADNVIVLDNNPEKARLVGSLGAGFTGICTDWMKKSGPNTDRARVDDLHEMIRAICRTDLLNSKGADMLINCVPDPRAAFDHAGVLAGTIRPVIVQAGGSRESISWSAETNRRFMIAEATITFAYRYQSEDFRPAIDCISANRELVGRLVGSITNARKNGNSGALEALEGARSGNLPSVKAMVNYATGQDDREVFDNA